MGIPYGITKIDTKWQIPPKAKSEILAAVGRDEQGAAEFLEAIRIAIIRSDAATKIQEQLSRDELK